MTDREKKNRAALLWDESFLWGIMAHKALDENGLAHDIVCSNDIKTGRLNEYRMLFVPGGWASNKVRALGDGGVDAIRQFVRNGGFYLGFCGGAGLATGDGIGLLPVRRRPTKERVPSFSGRIRVTTSDHSLWRDVADPVFHAWWPSQFVTDQNVSVLATYGEALPDAFSSDVNVGDAERAGNWQDLERTYGINLNPKRLVGEPAVIEGHYGQGKVLLSLVHFDTPGDRNGAAVLHNIWDYLDCGYPVKDAGRSGEGRHSSVTRCDPFLSELEKTVHGLIELGSRNFLWFWRNSMLLQWRRGIRGLEYCTLYIMIRELADILRIQGEPAGIPDFGERLERAGAMLRMFVADASELLVRERFALQNSHITYERCDDPAVQALREKLFSRAKSHGGLFKDLVDALDGLLYGMVTRRHVQD